MHHPFMVAELLREFVAGPWLDDLDLDGMERLNAKFHAETSERRDGDMIWRIPRRGGGVLQRCEARLMPRKGYLGRDGIKCLRDRGVFGLLGHAGTGGAGNEPKSYGSPCKD